MMCVDTMKTDTMEVDTTATDIVWEMTGMWRAMSKTLAEMLAMVTWNVKLPQTMPSLSARIGFFFPLGAPFLREVLPF